MQDHDDVALLRDDFVSAYESTGRWPTTQNDFTCLAWRTALTIDARIHPSPRNQKYVCAAKGKAPEKKKALLDSFGFLPWIDGIKPNGSHHLNYEFIVDFGVYRDNEDPDDQLPLLTMESEMYARYDTTHIVDKTNGYSYDYSKLLWCPSKFRLFFAGVGRRGSEGVAQRHQDLWETLATLNELYGRIWSGTLVVFMLGVAQKDRGASQVGLWDGTSFKRLSLFGEPR